MEVQLKKEIKDWEHRFKRENGRGPTKTDIVSYPQIRALYKKYRDVKLCKNSQSLGNSFDPKSNPWDKPVVISQTEERKKKSEPSFNDNFFSNIKKAVESSSTFDKSFSWNNNSWCKPAEIIQKEETNFEAISSIGANIHSNMILSPLNERQKNLIFNKVNSSSFMSIRNFERENIDYLDNLIMNLTAENELNSFSKKGISNESCKENLTNSTKSDNANIMDENTNAPKSKPIRSHKTNKSRDKVSKSTDDNFLKINIKVKRFSRKGTSKQNLSRTQKFREKLNRRKSSTTCFKCHQEGHWANKCPLNHIGTDKKKEN